MAAQSRSAAPSIGCGAPVSDAASTEVFIFGAGGPLTVEVEESLARQGRMVAGLVRNRPGDCLVLEPGKLMDVTSLPVGRRGRQFLCPLFTPANRRLAVAEALQFGLEPMPCLIDPTAIVAPSSTFGRGSYVNAGCVIGAAGVFGVFVMVNRATSIGHHAGVGDFASIGPGVVCAGQVTIGAGALIGAGAVIAPAVRIGANASVAPGTMVARDVPSGALAAGNPMRLRLREERHGTDLPGGAARYAR